MQVDYNICIIYIYDGSVLNYIGAWEQWACFLKTPITVGTSTSASQSFKRRECDRCKRFPYLLLKPIITEKPYSRKYDDEANGNNIFKASVDRREYFSQRDSQKLVKFILSKFVFSVVSSDKSSSSSSGLTDIPVS